MTTIDKVLPQELKAESRYAIRTRSLNSFGVPSDWSETLIIDTSAAGLASARRLIITNDGMIAYNNNGQMTFNYSSNAAIRTNLVTNPSAEVNTVGWSTLANSALSRVTTDYFVGEPTLLAAFKILASLASTAVGFVTETTRRISATPLLPYSVSAYVKVPNGQPEVSLRIGLRFYDIGGSLISESVSINSNNITVGSWIRISNVALTAPAATSKIGVVIYSSSSMPLNSFYLIDGVLVEQTSILRDYFDGSTSAGTSVWTGVAHDSSSTLDNSGIYSVNGGVFTESTIQTSRLVGALTSGNGVILDKDGIRVYPPTGGVPTFSANALTGVVTITGYTPVGTAIPIGGAAADVNANVTTINGGMIRTGLIQSTSYSGVTDGSAFSSTGTTYNLNNGSITSKQFRVDTSGNAVFAGALSAASGSFAGSLSAATGSFAGSLSAATGTFAGSLSAATGTFTGTLSAASGTFTGSLSGASGTFTGTLSGGAITGSSITGSSIAIGSGSTVFHVDTSGNIWSGGTTFNNAPFAVDGNGVIRIGINSGGADWMSLTSVSGNGNINLGLAGSTITAFSGATLTFGSTLTTDGNFYTNSGAGQFGAVWPISSSFTCVRNSAMGSSGYGLICNGSDTYISSSGAGSTHIRGADNNTAYELIINSSGATQSGGLKVNGSISGGGAAGFGVSGGSGAVLTSDAGSNNIHFNWDGAFRCYVDASLVKTFVIEHPVNTSKYLVHACAEGPTADVFYRGEGQLINGECTITLPDYFETLTELEGRTVQITPIYTPGHNTADVAASRIVDGKFTVGMLAGFVNLEQEFYWRVDAIRKNTTFEVEPNKNDVTIAGDGPYTYVAS